jgi:hypothetical protein
MKSSAVLGATVLIGFGFVAMSCSSDPTSGNNGGSSSGGITSSSGGATSSSGGAKSSGGATSANPGTGGNQSNSGGSTSTSAPGCTSANTQSAPSDNLIGDFAGDAGAGDAGAGLAVAGGISVWGGSAQPTWSVDGDTLTLTENGTATTAAQYVGAVLYFNKCVDAVSFSGVEFTISGTMSGCTLVYSANYSGTTDSAVDQKGTCVKSGTTGCYAPQKSLTVSSSPTQVRIGWDDTTGGSPVGPIDESKLTGLQWQFTIPGGTGTCSASITISNLKFY